MHHTAESTASSDPHTEAGSSSPGREDDASPFRRIDIARRLRQFPTVAGDVVEHARTLAVLVRRRFLDYASAGITRASERRIDGRYTHLDDVCHFAWARLNLLPTHISNDDCAVRSDVHLRAMRVPDPHAFLETERILQPRTSG